MSHDRVEEIRKLRRLMGTAPEAEPEFETKFYRGVEGIRVKLVDGPRNPYRAMYAMGVSTWGHIHSLATDRWEDTPPEAREAVVRAVLGFNALPLAMEAPKFTFEVYNLTRWSFDQIARARIGAVFASLGTRDNNHLGIPFRMHEATWRNESKRGLFVGNAKNAKDAYRTLVESGRGSWQEARTFLPISVVHRFTMSINFLALRGMCARRMTFSEAEDTVAVAWLLRDRLMKADAYPLLAAHLRPACDGAGTCRYHKAHTISEAFGCLFKSCGRHPVKSAPGNPDFDYEYADFNVSCSDRKTIQDQLQISIPERTMDPDKVELTSRDRFLLGFQAQNEEEFEDWRWYAQAERGVDANPFPLPDSGAAVEPVDLP